MSQPSNVRVGARGLQVRWKNSAIDSQCGMTLLELLIAFMMLVTFTGVVVMVMEFTLRFLGDAEKAAGNGVLIDHMEAQLSMDELIRVLSQPGIGKDEIIENMTTANCIDNPTLECNCTDNPTVEWRGEGGKSLPIPEIYPPVGYQFCLSTTSEIEDDWDVLLGSGSPGIYILQALPDGPPDPSRLPVRRLFCRPRPFC